MNIFIPIFMYSACAMWLAGFRRRMDTTIDEQRVGEVRIRVNIPWGLYPASPALSKCLTGLAVAYLVFTGYIGIEGVALKRDAYWFAFTAAMGFGVWKFFVKPYPFVLGSHGFMWKGRSYSWDSGSLKISNDQFAFSIRANAANVMGVNVNIFLGNLPLLDSKRINDLLK